MPSNYSTYQISPIILSQLSQEDFEILIHSKFHWNFNLRYPIYIYNIYWTHIGTIYSVKSLSMKRHSILQPLSKDPLVPRLCGSFSLTGHVQSLLGKEEKKSNESHMIVGYEIRMSHLQIKKNSCLPLLQPSYTNLHSILYSIIHFIKEGRHCINAFWSRAPRNCYLRQSIIFFSILDLRLNSTD